MQCFSITFVHLNRLRALGPDYMFDVCLRAGESTTPPPAPLSAEYTFKPHIDPHSQKMLATRGDVVESMLSWEQKRVRFLLHLIMACTHQPLNEKVGDPKRKLCAGDAH